MDTYTWVSLMAIALLLAIIAYYVVSMVANPDGKGAEAKTNRILTRFGILHRCKALKDVQVTGKNGQQEQVENLMVGPFGILIIKTLGACGDYYGRSGDAEWFFNAQNGGKKSVENPETSLERQAAVLLQKMTASGIYNIAIHKAIYLPGNPRRTQIFAKASIPVLAFGKLKRHLNEEKFEKETGLDVGKILSILQEA